MRAMKGRIWSWSRGLGRGMLGSLGCRGRDLLDLGFGILKGEGGKRVEGDERLRE